MIRTPSRQSICPPAACVLTLLLGGIARAGVLDQEFDEFDGASHRFGAAVYDERARAQTFTVGRDGVLERIELQVSRKQLSPATVPLVAELRRTAPDGSPDLGAGALLASLSFPPASITTNELSAAFVGLDLAALAFPVHSGDRLAIVLTTTSPQSAWYLWNTAEADRATYPGGDAFFRAGATGPFTRSSDQDSGFRTYVAVPEPTALLLIATGVLLLIRRRAIP